MRRLRNIVYTAGASSTVATLQAAISAAVTDGTLSTGTALTLTSGKAVIAESGTAGINVS